MNIQIKTALNNAYQYTVVAVSNPLTWKVIGIILSGVGAGYYAWIDNGNAALIAGAIASFIHAVLPNGIT